LKHFQIGIVLDLERHGHPGMKPGMSSCMMVAVRSALSTATTFPLSGYRFWLAERRGPHENANAENRKRNDKGDRSFILDHDDES
jgi:hypothetical protein